MHLKIVFIQDVVLLGLSIDYHKRGIEYNIQNRIPNNRINVVLCDTDKYLVCTG